MVRPTRRVNSKHILLLVILLAFGLRAQRLSFQPLWADEGYSIYFAAMPLADMASLTAVDIHPPLYYALLRGWRLAAGNGPEAARLLSVIIGTLLVPAMYCFGRKLIPAGGRAWGGLAAAVVTAVSPAAVYYSQEVRMYGLVTLLCLAGSLFFVRALEGDKKSAPAYALAMVLALHTMYYAAFVVVFQVLYLLFKFRGRSALLKWPTVIAVLYVPWALFAGGKLAQYVQQKVVADADAPLGLGAFVAAHLTAFSMGRLSAEMQPFRAAGLLFAAAALAGGWYLWRQSPPKQGALGLVGLYLLVPLFLGWLVNLASPFNPPYFERALLLAAPAWWLMVAAGATWLWRARPPLAMAAAGLLLAANLIALADFYTVPRYPNDDYRPLLAEIAARAAPADALLASYQWQLGYYHAYLPPSGPQFYPAPEWGVLWGTDPAAMRRDLSDLLQTHVVWFPAHQTAGHIWEDRAEAVMAQIGYPAILRWYTPSTKLSVVAPQSDTHPGPRLNFARKLQADVALPVAAHFESGRGIIPVAVTWTALADLERDYLITLKLVDPTGEIWAKRDARPQANQRAFSGLRAGQTLADRHGLLISAGTPPGTYTLRLSLGEPGDAPPLDLVGDDNQPQGVEATLMTVAVDPARQPLGVAALDAQTPVNIPFGKMLNLTGFSVGEWSVKTGQTLPVNLFWQSRAAPLPPLTTFVQLQDDAGRAVALTERPPAYPTPRWTAGTLLRDLHRLRIPPTLPP
ncbi:MAG: glycosyltransferase family 39 protein, partial [Anaerolineae bacterium]